MRVPSAKLVSSLVLFAAAGCATATRDPASARPGAKKRFERRATREPASDPAAEPVEGLARVDYHYGTSLKDPSHSPNNKLMVARPGDNAQFYGLTKIQPGKSHFGENLTRLYRNESNSGQCIVAGAVKDAKVVTNPASRFTALYVQNGSLFGLYGGDEYPKSYVYNPYCEAGPSKTDWLGGKVVQDAGGNYQFWTYLPGPDENPETSLAFFVLNANPSINLTVYSGDGKPSSDGVISALKLNPCFGISGKPYKSFVAFAYYKNDKKVTWIDPKDPHGFYANESGPGFVSVDDFMKKNKISNDGGKSCL